MRRSAELQRAQDDLHAVQAELASKTAMLEARVDKMFAL